MSLSYLFELGCEELPSSALPRLSAQFHEALVAQLKASQIQHGEIELIAAPRRLGALISGLASETQPIAFERRGPPVSAAYKDNKPTPALEGFCRGLGISPDQTGTIETDKGAWVSYQGVEPGKAVELVLPEVLSAVFSELPLAKPMRWGSGRDEFLRPVHWIVSLLNDRHVPIDMFGVTSGCQSFGHRFHSPAAVTITHATTYMDQMEAAYVLPSFRLRRLAVWESVKSVANDHGVVVHDDDALLDEITSLVEWPVALCGEFEKEFLEVPDIALIAAMRGHQKYFHTWSKNGRLNHRFITVANLESRDPSQVVSGNQRVIRARLSDARFFFLKDKTQTLASRRSQLDHITFHPALGSLGEKTKRVIELMRELAPHFGIEKDVAERLGLLSRCDLVTEMVLEFDELQGQMGAIYALLDGEPEVLARGIAGLYQPAGASDAIPEDAMGLLLAMCDKLDTLAGLFAAKQPPTGSKDPFALRRAAIGLIRLNAHPMAQIDLLPSFQQAFEMQPAEQADEDFAKLIKFVVDREHVRLVDKGLRTDVVAAAQSQSTLATAATEKRAYAISSFLTHDDLPDLVSGNKRIANLLSKNNESLGVVDARLFTQTEETLLFDTAKQVDEIVTDAVSRETFDLALSQLASLRDPIDQFFENVMVNHEDSAIRNNRLALLTYVRSLFLSVGDLSLLQV